MFLKVTESWVIPVTNFCLKVNLFAELKQKQVENMNIIKHLGDLSVDLTFARFRQPTSKSYIGVVVLLLLNPFCLFL